MLGKWPRGTERTCGGWRLGLALASGFFQLVGLGIGLALFPRAALAELIHFAVMLGYERCGAALLRGGGIGMSRTQVFFEFCFGGALRTTKFAG